MKEIKTLKRFAAIISIGLKPGSFKNLEDLAEKLDANNIEPVAYRTLVRDLEALRTEFGINFQYSNAHRCWIKIESDEVADHAQFLNLLDLEGLSRTLRLAFEGFSFLELEAQTAVQQIQPLITKILEAIQRHRVVKLTYHAFAAEKDKKYEIEPLKIKEYRNRWYLAGADVNDNHIIKTFGIERMVSMELSQKSFDPDKLKEQVKNRFANVLGVTLLHNQQAETIHVKVSPKFSNYLISIPLHASQQFQGTDENGWSILTWRLVVNQELVSELLRFGQDVEVLSPPTLVSALVNNLKTSLSKYA
jgi:hypothetical protein